MLKQIGPYRVVRAVGRGGLGVVYYALGPARSPVALKVLNHGAGDTVASRRLAREFQALSAITHRNIVRVLDAGVQDDVPYLAMEFVDGLPLRSYLDLEHDDADWAPRPPPPPDDLSVSVPGVDPLSLSASAASAVSPLSWLDGDEPDSMPSPRARPGGAPSPLSDEQRRQLNRPGRLVRLRDVMAQLCDALAFIHQRGLVHRDVKPSNILVADGGEAKLVDFGLVKLTQSSGNTTATGHVVGTWRYMSPEQAKGEAVDGRSDLYALGGVLYEMLCGQPPFCQQQPAALLQAIVHQPPPPLSALNPDADPLLSGIALKLLSKEREGRFQTAEEVARTLRSCGRREARA